MNKVPGSREDQDHYHEYASLPHMLQDLIMYVIIKCTIHNVYTTNNANQYFFRKRIDCFDEGVLLYMTF